MSRKPTNGDSEYHRKKRQDVHNQRLFAATKDPRATPARTVPFGVGIYVPPVWRVREGAGQLVERRAA